MPGIDVLIKYYAMLWVPSVPDFSLPIHLCGWTLPGGSYADNQVSGDPYDDDIFRSDTRMGTTALLCLDASGTKGNWPPDYPASSADGRDVAFQSNSSNLVSGDTNAALDVFVVPATSIIYRSYQPRVIR